MSKIINTGNYIYSQQHDDGQLPHPLYGSIVYANTGDRASNKYFHLIERSIEWNKNNELKNGSPVGNFRFQPRYTGVGIDNEYWVPVSGRYASALSPGDIITLTDVIESGGVSGSGDIVPQLNQKSFNITGVEVVEDARLNKYKFTKVSVAQNYDLGREMYLIHTGALFQNLDDIYFRDAGDWHCRTKWTYDSCIGGQIVASKVYGTGDIRPGAAEENWSTTAKKSTKLNHPWHLDTWKLVNNTKNVIDNPTSVGNKAVFNTGLDPRIQDDLPRMHRVTSEGNNSNIENYTCDSRKAECFIKLEQPTNSYKGTTATRMLLRIRPCGFDDQCVYDDDGAPLTLDGKPSNAGREIVLCINEPLFACDTLPYSLFNINDGDGLKVREWFPTYGIDRSLCGSGSGYHPLDRIETYWNHIYDVWGSGDPDGSPVTYGADFHRHHDNNQWLEDISAGLGGIRFLGALSGQAANDNDLTSVPVGASKYFVYFESDSCWNCGPTEFTREDASIMPKVLNLTVVPGDSRYNVNYNCQPSMSEDSNATECGCFKTGVTAADCQPPFDAPEVFNFTDYDGKVYLNNGAAIRYSGDGGDCVTNGWTPSGGYINGVICDNRAQQDYSAYSSSAFPSTDLTMNYIRGGSITGRPINITSCSDHYWVAGYEKDENITIYTYYLISNTLGNTVYYNAPGSTPRPCASDCEYPHGWYFDEPPLGAPCCSTYSDAKWYTYVSASLGVGDFSSDCNIPNFRLSLHFVRISVPSPNGAWSSLSPPATFSCTGEFPCAGDPENCIPGDLHPFWSSPTGSGSVYGWNIDTNVCAGGGASNSNLTFGDYGACCPGQELYTYNCDYGDEKGTTFNTRYAGEGERMLMTGIEYLGPGNGYRLHLDRSLGDTPHGCADAFFDGSGAGYDAYFFKNGRLTTTNHDLGHPINSPVILNRDMMTEWGQNSTIQLQDELKQWCTTTTYTTSAMTCTSTTVDVNNLESIWLYPISGNCFILENGDFIYEVSGRNSGVVPIPPPEPGPGGGSPGASGIGIIINGELCCDKCGDDINISFVHHIDGQVVDLYHDYYDCTGDVSNNFVSNLQANAGRGPIILSTITKGA